MVFILIGAVQAAKHAKNEYHKDKKRNAVITPVEGSQDMMADRASSSQLPPSGTTDWWGTTRTDASPTPTPDAPANHNGVGAWSRDHVIQQVSDANADTPSSAYESSASASTDTSTPVRRPSGGPTSSNASPSHTVRPSSQRSGHMNLPASISHDEQERDASPDQEHSGSELVKRSSLNEVGGSDERRTLRKEDSTLMRDSSTGDNDTPATAVQQRSQIERTSAGQLQQKKTFVQGSFEEALRRKPSVKEERLAPTMAETKGETVSALARNASKAHRGRPSWTQGNGSVLARKGSTNASVTNAEPVEGTASSEVISALARNTSKGPRRRLEQLVKVSQPRGSFEAHIESGKTGGVANGSHAGAAGNPGELQKCVSAFAGASTKKRVGRRPPTSAQFGGAPAGIPRSTGVGSSTEPMAETAAASTTVVGSSIYAEGSMKKRTSRR